MAGIQQFDQAASQILAEAGQYLAEKSGVIQGYGHDLFLALGALAFAWMGIRLILEAGELTSIMGGLIRTILLAGIVYWLVSAGYSIVFVDGIAGSLDQIANTLLPGGSMSGTLSESLSAFYRAGTATMELTNDFAAGESWNPLNIMGKIYSSLAQVGALFLSGLLLLLAGGVFFIVAMASQFMVTIAIILGPVFIPWLLLPAATFVFDGWLRFLISAALWKVLAAIIVGITSGVFQSLASKAEAAAKAGSSANYGEVMLASFVAGLTALLAAYLLLQIPSIAAALAGGGTGVYSARIPRRAGKVGQQPTKPEQPKK
ncbi:hypothetical protein MTYP_00686 [Methylophilaceae bacterium]|nr:hypothetical protein MTYP_00686 [Methylophilaceae bacterium]